MRLMLALVAAMASSPILADELVETGYFKSADRHRVLACHAPAAVPDEDVQRLFDRAMNAPGRLTRAVVYFGDVPHPGHDLTLADSLQLALIITAAPPNDRWLWSLHNNPAGERSVSRQ